MATNREGGYNSGRSSYGNNRPSYGNEEGNTIVRLVLIMMDRQRLIPLVLPGEGMSADGMKKRRPRVGDTRVDYNDSRSSGGTVTHPDVRMVTITLMAVIVRGVVDMEIIAVLLTIIIAVPVEEVDFPKDSRVTTCVRKQIKYKEVFGGSERTDSFEQILI